MVVDARRFEPLTAQAAELLNILAKPERLMIVCDLIPEARDKAKLSTRLAIDAPELEHELGALSNAGILQIGNGSNPNEVKLISIEAAEIVDALCSAFLGESFSKRAEIPFRANQFLVGGAGKNSGANI